MSRSIVSSLFRSRTAWLVLAAGVFTFAAAPKLCAEVIFDNLSTSRNDFNGFYSAGWGAQGFNTGGDPLKITSATLLLRQREGNLAPTLELFSDSSGAIGSSLAAFAISGSVPTSDFGQVSFTTPGVDLAANTSYWMVLSFLGGAGQGEFAQRMWWGTSLTSSSASGFTKYETLGPYPPSGGSTYTNQYGMMKLEAVAVPEPSTYAVVLAGIACGGFSMWRRRKRA